MDKITNTALFFAAATGMLAGCASIDEVATWNALPLGSTWQMSQKNTGSYGKDDEIVMTRSDTEWNGHKAVKVTNVLTGNSIIALPNGKWLALVTKDGKAAVTYDPPIGYEFPMKVGQSWKTHHKATNHVANTSMEYDYSCTVEALETVTVPAGTFDALRIACENELSRELTWFIPANGLHAKMELRRKPTYPTGEGTRYAELTAVNLAK